MTDLSEERVDSSWMPPWCITQNDENHFEMEQVLPKRKETVRVGTEMSSEHGMVFTFWHVGDDNDHGAPLVLVPFVECHKMAIHMILGERSWYEGCGFYTVNSPSNDGMASARHCHLLVNTIYANMSAKVSDAFARWLLWKTQLYMSVQCKSGGGFSDVSTLWRKR